MRTVSTIAGVLLILSVLLDAFETVVLPRRVQRQYRISAWFYRKTWIPFRRICSKIKSASRRENALGYFGPLSLIFLLALWAVGLVFSFALLQYGAGRHLQLDNGPSLLPASFIRAVRLSSPSVMAILFRLGNRSCSVCTRSGHGFWLSRHGHWLSANHLFGLLASRDRNFPARCARRLATHRRRTTRAVWQEHPTGSAGSDFS